MSTSSGQSGFGSGFGWSQGTVAAQPHVKVPDGTYEEEHGRRGFFGRTSHLYHRHPPTGWTRIEGELKPRAYYATKVEPFSLPGEQLGRPVGLLENADVRLGIAKFPTEMTVYVRNGDGDEVRFVHEGAGTLETDYGDLDYKAGDYLVIPRGTTYRFVAKTPNAHLVIESAGEIELPERGMLGRHAQFDPMIMRTPKLAGAEKTTGKNAKGEWQLQIKREGDWTNVFYPFNPINTAGWKGDLSPWAIHVDEIRPVVSPRYHLPPSVHTTFVSRNFVICSFLPRPLESEEGAMKVPFYHRNIDFDEVLFYHAGNFFSREGISVGAITWHPQGIHHGPHPNAATNAADKDFTHEIAVMVDTRNPLRATSTAETVEYREYHMSWRADQKR
ncbi:MAG: homogentisate 1,2-dioxygenase [Bdellovibrionales bacterium]|nr:homogentisate 1,2-dioxygenase [Bdellovibrionales bacterium]